MSNEKWFAAEITVNKENSEAVEFALNELDSIGNEINNLNKKDVKELTVIGYFNKLPSLEVIKNELSKALNIYGLTDDAILNIETKEIENQDWLAEWKKHWKPTETDRFIISPPWEDVASTDKITIKIEPNMAFGTGTHETTRLCLSTIEQNYESEMSFFDVGTGTGILSMAAAKIQGESKSSKGKIIGCDTDKDSIKIAKENAQVNDIDSIDFYVGTIIEDSPKFDFVCANVTVDIIIPMLPLLVEKFKEILVLSGILIEQEKLVLAKLKKLGVKNADINIDGEWISITIKK